MKIIIDQGKYQPQINIGKCATFPVSKVIKDCLCNECSLSNKVHIATLQNVEACDGTVNKWIKK